MQIIIQDYVQQERRQQPQAHFLGWKVEEKLFFWGDS